MCIHVCFPQLSFSHPSVSLALSPSLSPQSFCPHVCSYPSPSVKPICLSLHFSCVILAVSPPVFSFASPVSLCQFIPAVFSMCSHFPHHLSVYILCQFPFVFCQVVCSPRTMFSMRHILIFMFQVYSMSRHHVLCSLCLVYNLV